MKIGIPTEIKPGEQRVALTPADCASLMTAGHAVHIQAGAGEGAGFADAAYTDAGCTIEPDAAALYAAARLIVKVKEPLDSDLAHLSADHLLFCYLHLAAAPELVTRLKTIGLTAIGFETVVEDGPDGPTTPLLAPMSAIAGRLAVHIGAWHLHSPRGGRGTLLGGISGHSGGKVTIIGAGVAGHEAATLAHGMGAAVTILDINGARLQALARALPGIEAVVSTDAAIADAMADTDLLIGAVYVIGRKAPEVITRSHLNALPAGAVAVDISIDQGGCMADSQPGTHASPVYQDGHILRSAITNLPAAAPRTASEVLSAAIVPYVQQLADNNWSDSLRGGVNIAEGELKIEL